ncbi:unnamed protein product [Lactuca saligna]|uniref:F-box domain-containing protein n=1 Tax=Lactuca saligna TaxID=75948 RepID=A0AA36E1D8_LACSI|nr:unnamed protein product [Lactuca saligna]
MGETFNQTVCSSSSSSLSTWKSDIFDRIRQQQGSSSFLCRRPVNQVLSVTCILFYAFKYIIQSLNVSSNCRLHPFVTSREDYIYLHELYEALCQLHPPPLPSSQTMSPHSLFHRPILHTLAQSPFRLQHIGVKAFEKRSKQHTNQTNVLLAFEKVKSSREEMKDKGKGKSQDRISTLPQDTIEKILTHMPIQDALRTSILSRKWRHWWKGMPKLVFDDNYLNTSSSSKEIRKYKFVKQKYQETNLLEHLHFTHCFVELPITFNGFITLRSLKLCDVVISAKMLQQLLTNCPILEEFILTGCQDISCALQTKCTFLELSKCTFGNEVGSS